jgi:LCP family protein required for cell wall assembly
VLRRIVAGTVAAALVAVIAVLGAAIWAEASLRRVTVFADYAGRPAGGSGTNWLLVGSDSRADLTEQQQAELATGGDVGNGRTDTILLVHVPGPFAGQPTTMVSIPRDSYVDIPGWGRDKINVAFAEGGPALLAQTVEQSTGLRLDHYAEIGFGGFGGVVDALGGVTMCLPEPITDPLAGIDLPAGCQVLDGPDALGYVRTRATPRADLDRMRHQREFMSGMLQRALSPGVWLNPWRWYAVPHAALGALTVDNDAHVWSLGRLAWALHGSYTTLTVPIGEFTGNESGSVLIWDSATAASLFEVSCPVSPFCSHALVRPGWLVAIHPTPMSRQNSTSS